MLKLKAAGCRRCGSTQVGHTCKSVRPAAVKACKRIAGELLSDDTDSDPVDLCSDDDEVFSKPSAKKQRPSACGSSCSASAPTAAPAAVPAVAPAAAPVVVRATCVPIMTALSNYVGDLEKTIADLRKDVQSEAAARQRAEQQAMKADAKLFTELEKGKARAAATSAMMPAVFGELVSMVNTQFTRRKVELEKVYQKASTTPAATGYAFRYLNEHGKWGQLPSNAAVEQALTDLCNGVSPNVTYSAGSNSYDAEIDSSPTSEVQGEMQSGELCIKQTNNSHYSHTVRPMIATPGSAVVNTPHEVAKDLLYGDPVVTLDDKEIDQLLAKIDANEAQTTTASAQLATLATNWSALASQHKYDPSQTTIWSNPLLLKQWLTTAKARKLSRARIVMHGSGHYESLRKDPQCYNMLFSNGGCARGAGLYVSVADHIPSDYNGGAPIGTGLLGLLLCGDDTDEGIESQAGSARTIGQGKNLHIYTRYKLGATNEPSAIRLDPNCKEAIRVLDLSRFLPLGLAHT